MKNHRIFKKNGEYDQDEYIRLLYLTSMCVCVYPQACVPTKSLQQCQLCDPMDCSPPGSSVRGILQARKPGWVAEPSSGGSSWLRGGTRVSCSSCIAGGFFTIKPQQEPMYPHINKQFLDWYQPDVWVFSSVLTLPTRRLIKITQGKGSCQVHALLQTPTASPGYLHFWLKSVLQRFPWSLPWVRLIC